MSRTEATAATTFYGLSPAAAMLFSRLFPGLFSAPSVAPAWVAARSCAADRRRLPIRNCKKLYRLIPLLAAVWLTACSSSYGAKDHAVAAAPPPDLRADQARFYFYRPNDSLFPAIQPPVIINGRKVGTSIVGEAFYRDAQPGRYEIFLASDDDDRLTVTLAPGEIHYVRTSITMGWLGPHLSPKSVDADQGEQELQGLALVEPRLED
jgi:Protein of unknown function (DUF2846)